jgi:hypothetical protein
VPTDENDQGTAKTGYTDIHAFISWKIVETTEIHSFG